MKEVPEKLLHGYDGAYQAEKHKTAKKSETFMESLKGSISGLLIVLKNPYVFGIFSLVFFYDFIITIFDLLILLSANKTYETAGELTAFYSFYTLCMHGVGLSIAFLGTVPLQRILGARASLFITPIFSLMLVLTAFFFPTTTVFTFWGMPFDVLFVTLILLRGTNYGLNHPTREMLYIPTTKMIKFKAKAWTDSFGTRFAKLSGSFFNKQIANTGTSYILYASTLMSSTLLCCWIVVAYFLGTRMQKAIDTNTVIGEEAENK
jgi:AAA family ATP:ADP antiporter